MTQTDTIINDNDEIDLIQLASNLWNEKLTIIICTVLFTALGIIYITFTKPIYEASVQIEPPLSSSLASLNNSPIITISEQLAFSQLLNVLESDSHRANLIDTQKELIAELYNTKTDNISSENISPKNLYTIRYPNIKKQKNSLEPDIYTLTTQGTDRTLIKTLLDENIDLAAKHLTEKWKLQFNNTKVAKIEKLTADLNHKIQNITERKENTISRLTEETTLKVKQLEDQLTARKAYVTQLRKNRITRLEEALKIASVLKIKKPSSLSRLGNQSKSSQVEVNTQIKDQQDPLYLRGTTLLSAELDSLRLLPEETFLDSRIIELETELQKASNNRKIDILLARKNDVAFNEELQSLKEGIRNLNIQEFPSELELNFQNTPAIAAKRAIKPRKTLILAMSIILGGMIGLLVAIGRITYANHKTKTNEV